MFNINLKEFIYLFIALIVMYIILVLVFSIMESELILWNQYFIGHYVGIFFALGFYLLSKNINKNKDHT